ncbi:helix-turn-helix domain-containing protein [Solibacillus silvestris]
MGILLGKEIVKMRKLKNITQKQLCKDICSQATISMIEKGKMLPGIDILLSLSLRLNIPITHFIDIIYLENANLKIDLLDQVELLLSQMEYEKIFGLASNVLNSESESNWYKYYFNWLYYLSGYYIKKVTLDEAILQITKISQETPDYELNKNYLLARIQNSLAVLYAIKKEYSKSLFYYNKIDLNILGSHLMFDSNTFKLKVIFNKVKTTYDMGSYKEAIEQAVKGIAESVKNEKMTYIGNFYYYLGQCYEQLEYPEEEIKYQYRRAEIFLEILERESLLKILRDLKGHWLV